jgi:hypothetical protein
MRIIIAVLLSVSAAHAQVVSLGMGMGAETCGKFSEEYKARGEDAEFDYFNWAQGFMSGMNVMSVTEKKDFRNLAAKSIPEQRASIRDYCNTRPLAYFKDAVVALYGSLPIIGSKE